MRGSNEAVDVVERYTRRGRSCQWNSVCIVDFDDYFEDLKGWKEHGRVLRVS